MNVLELCKLSKDAYEKESSIKKNWSKKGYNVNVIEYNKIKWEGIYNLQAIILHKNDKVIVAFRGTDNFTNFLKDIDNDFTDANKIWAGAKGKIHHGFAKAFNKIFQKEVYKKLPPHKEIIFTGHSLGGAIAHLSAVDLSLSTNYNGYKPVKVVTFGQPKVGNKEFINYTKNKIKLWRVLNRITHRTKTKVFGKTIYGIPIPYDDLVPDYPSKKYSHCGRKIKVNYYNSKLLTKLLNIEAHKIDKYQKSISKNKIANEII